MLAEGRKDDVVTFEQLGVDRLFVDEAHNYKNLFLYTKMRNVAGLSTTDAQKSRNSAACGPNGLPANHALGAVLLCCQCCAQRFNKVRQIITFVVSHDHVGIFLNGDWLHHSVNLLERSHISDCGFAVYLAVSFAVGRIPARVLNRLF